MTCGFFAILVRVPCYHGSRWLSCYLLLWGLNLMKQEIDICHIMLLPHVDIHNICG